MVLYNFGIILYVLNIHNIVYTVYIFSLSEPSPLGLDIFTSKDKSVKTQLEYVEFI